MPKRFLPTIVEAPAFAKRRPDLLDDESYRLLQVGLAEKPDAGSVIPGSRGLRKVRWEIEGRGKRGGTRTIYYWAVTQQVVLLLFIYPKSEKDDLTKDQLKALALAVGEEFKMRDDLFQELLESVREGGKILRGEVAPAATYTITEPDVASVRRKYGLSQTQFAQLFGVNKGTLQGWEQGRRTPTGAARLLLMVADRHPEAVMDVVQMGPKGKVLTGTNVLAGRKISAEKITVGASLADRKDSPRKAKRAKTSGGHARHR